MRIFFNQLNNVINQCNEGISRAKMVVSNDLNDIELQSIALGQIQGLTKIKKHCLKQMEYIKKGRFNRYKNI